MKTLLTSSFILVAAAGHALSDTHATRSDDSGPRTEGTTEVEAAGSGMTSQSSVNTVVVGDDATQAQSTTAVPDLDDGTVVDNPRTPATAVIDDGQVETQSTTTANIGQNDVMDGARQLTPDMATAENLTGAIVLDANDAQVGEVEDVRELDGVPVAIMDIGGFLGMGEHRIALPVAELVTTGGEDAIQVRTAITQDQLENLPEYDG